MHRRDFLASAAAGLGLAAAGRAQDPAARAPFRLAYAPHFGMFENHAADLLDQLQFAADEGFRAWEDNGLPRRPIELQERIGAKLQQLGMAMGVFVAHADFDAPTFASGRQEHVDRVLAGMHAAVAVARRVRARWCTVVPGTLDHQQDLGYQTANAVALLQRCAEIAGEAQLTIVLEPLNFRDHPRCFLTKIAQAFAICRAVGSPWCKVLDDLYHQQVTEGNLIPNIDRAWSEIAYFQVGDNPGRCEPGTGEINYRNVFRHIHGKGFAGIVGMEHGKAGDGKEGERRLIDAYRLADAW
jgi:hydroxypyruvate isomerase